MRICACSAMVPMDRVRMCLSHLLRDVSSLAQSFSDLYGWVREREGEGEGEGEREGEGGGERERKRERERERGRE